MHCYARRKRFKKTFQEGVELIHVNKDKDHLGKVEDEWKMLPDLF
jgi:hypothetical protein